MAQTTVGRAKAALGKAVADGQAVADDLERKHAESFARWQELRKTVPRLERMRVDAERKQAIATLDDLKARLAASRSNLERLAPVPDDVLLEVDGQGGVTFAPGELERLRALGIVTDDTPETLS